METNIDTNMLEEELSLSKHLKQFTRTTHESLDQQIMNFEPFTHREKYKCFLRMQLRLHKVTESLYFDPQLNKLLPNLKERCRIDAIIQDCKDLALADALILQDNEAAAAICISSTWQGLGWIYTHEGSTIGAAFLLKYAKKDLELTEDFGARHLASHHDGRGLNWRNFKQLLDDLKLTPEQRQECLQGAQDAFTFVRSAVYEVMV